MAETDNAVLRWMGASPLRRRYSLSTRRSSQMGAPMAKDRDRYKRR